jgi:uncharacterized protein YbjT (DUF2867 family)
MSVPRDRPILVTGATGLQGGALARRLLDAGCQVRAMTRRPDGDRARALADAGAEVVAGDFDRPETLDEPLAGAWGVFSVQNTWEAGVEREEAQGKLFAERARQAGVEHFVYASVGSAHRRTGIPHFDNKWRVEQRIRELGFPSHTVVRPVFFMENLLAPQIADSIREGTFAFALPEDTPLQMIAAHDLGAFHFLAFDRWKAVSGEALDVAGDEVTPLQAARHLGEALGREVRFHRVPIEEVRKTSEEYAVMLEWFEEVGYEADIRGLEERFGLTTTRFREWARQVDWG